MPNSWPDWLDEVSAHLAERDRTCPDCFTVIDGVTVFPRFRGDGCDHSDDA